MKRTVILLIAAILVIGAFNVSAAEQSTDWNYLIQHADWQTFSKNLVMALQSDNLGLQVSAMTLVIKYADKVNVNNAALKLVSLYRNNENERVRQLALVTIHAIQNQWALGIVKRDIKFENSAKMKRLMLSAVNN